MHPGKSSLSLTHALTHGGKVPMLGGGGRGGSRGGFSGKDLDLGGRLLHYRLERRPARHQPPDSRSLVPPPPPPPPLPALSPTLQECPTAIGTMRRRLPPLTGGFEISFNTDEPRVARGRMPSA